MAIVASGICASATVGRSRSTTCPFDVIRAEVMGLLGPMAQGHKSTILRVSRLSAAERRIWCGYAAIDVILDGIEAREGSATSRRRADLSAYIEGRDERCLRRRPLRGYQGAGDSDRRGGGGQRPDWRSASRRTASSGACPAAIERVALPGGAARAPRMLVLDERQNGLDPRKIIEFTRRLVRDLPRTAPVLADIARHGARSSASPLAR